MPSTRTMRILVHGINYHPETVGIGQYTTEMCEDLADRGHEVTVVTALPYYPWWEVPEQYRGRLTADEEREGVEVRRTWLHVPKKVTTPGRIFHELSFTTLSGLRVLARRDFDLLVSVSPPLFLGAVARLWRAVTGKPYVFVVKDLQPDAAADLGMLGPVGRAALGPLYGLERWSYRGADLVTVLTEGMRRKVLAKGIEARKVEVFPDWIDADRLRPVDPRAFRERFDLGDRFVVLHAGNMGVKQGLENVLEAARLLQDQEDVVVLLVGEGARKDALERRARQMKLENVRFLPLQPREDVAAMHSAADLCLLSQRPEVSDIVMPCKVLGIFACGRPIIATARRDTDVARTVEEAGAGLVVRPGEPSALAEAVLAAREQPDRRRAWGEAARRWALEHWEKDGVLAAFEARLRRLGGDAARD